MRKPFEKGNKQGKGRPKGSPNAFSRTAKEAFQFAFDELGGWTGLARWADKNNFNRTTFYKLYARLIPIDIQSKGESITQFIARIDSQGRVSTTATLPEANGSDIQPGEVRVN